MVRNDIVTWKTLRFQGLRHSSFVICCANATFPKGEGFGSKEFDAAWFSNECVGA
jgi:hypothetical protein